MLGLLAKVFTFLGTHLKVILPLGDLIVRVIRAFRKCEHEDDKGEKNEPSDRNVGDKSKKATDLPS